MHVKNGLIEVILRNETKEVKKNFAAKNISSIVLNKQSTLTASVVELALIHKIDIIFCDDYGDPFARIWYPGLGSTTKIRKAQLIASLTDTGVEFSKYWINGKISKRIELLKKLKKHREGKDALITSGIRDLENSLSKISLIKAKNIKEIDENIRGIEGSSGKRYFEILAELIPYDYKFQGRSFRPAKDPFNAALNYSYGILYSKIEKALIIAGIDPYLGFLHRDEYNMLSMVYDFVEPFRPVCEEIVFKLFSQKLIAKKNFETIINGVQLNKEGKAIISESLNKNFAEAKSLYRGKKQNTENVIRLEAHYLASTLLKRKFDLGEFGTMFSNNILDEL
ncbi:MAG: CRISPR-associated endonuclease Cas1 [Ignavibacteriaceae bacterium]|nr:CRISPR-associated endonuclease Cas1 [Ignavibacteriaceae bacterium]